MASMSNSEKEDLRLNFKEFLSGDIWGLAIDDFLEMNCIYFEPDCNNHGPEQKSIWLKYTSVVQSQLDYFLDLFGSDLDKLKSVLGKMNERAVNPIDSDKLAQVRAGDQSEESFYQFVELMLARRRELDRMTAEVLSELASKEHMQAPEVTTGNAEKRHSAASQKPVYPGLVAALQAAGKVPNSKKNQTSYIDDEEAIIDDIIKKSAKDVVMPDLYHSESHFVKLSPASQMQYKTEEPDLQPKPYPEPQSQSELQPKQYPEPKSQSSMRLTDLSSAPPIKESVPPIKKSIPPVKESVPPIKEVKGSGSAPKFPPVVHVGSDRAVKPKSEIVDMNGAQVGFPNTESCSWDNEKLPLPSPESDLNSFGATREYSSVNEDEDKSNRFRDLRQQLLHKKSKIRDEKAEQLNVPENVRPASGRYKPNKYRPAAPDWTDKTDSSPQGEQQSSSGDVYGVSVSGKGEGSRDLKEDRSQVRKNIFASVRDEVMDPK